MKELLSLIPLPWKLAGFAVLVFCIGGAGIFGAWKGYGFGYEKAKALGDAALAREQADREQENTARALAVAEAERLAREKLKNASLRANDLERQLLAAETAYAKERAALTRRINNAAQAAASTCTGLPAEWVREYNAALGAGSVSVSGYAGIPLVAGKAGTVSGAVSGVSHGQSLVTPADILAHARDYGAMCQRLSRQVNGWQETYDSWVTKGISDESGR